MGNPINHSTLALNGVTTASDLGSVGSRDIDFGLMAILGSMGTGSCPIDTTDAIPDDFLPSEYYSGEESEEAQMAGTEMAAAESDREDKKSKADDIKKYHEDLAEFHDALLRACWISTDGQTGVVEEILNFINLAQTEYDELMDTNGEKAAYVYLKWWEGTLQDLFSENRELARKYKTWMRSHDNGHWDQVMKPHDYVEEMYYTAKSAQSSSYGEDDGFSPNANLAKVREKQDNLLASNAKRQEAEEKVTQRRARWEDAESYKASTLEAYISQGLTISEAAIKVAADSEKWNAKFGYQPKS